MLLLLAVAVASAKLVAFYEDQNCLNPVVKGNVESTGCFASGPSFFTFECGEKKNALVLTEYRQTNCTGEGLVSIGAAQCAKFGNQFVKMDCGSTVTRRKLQAKARLVRNPPKKSKAGGQTHPEEHPQPSGHMYEEPPGEVTSDCGPCTEFSCPAGVTCKCGVCPVGDQNDNDDDAEPIPGCPSCEGVECHGGTCECGTCHDAPPAAAPEHAAPAPAPATEHAPAPALAQACGSCRAMRCAEDYRCECGNCVESREAPQPQAHPAPAAPPAQAPLAAKANGDNCKPANARCWDNLDHKDSCHLTCCSRQYKMGPNKYHVCVGSDLSVCWKGGHVCWQDAGDKSCEYNCCSMKWVEGPQDKCSVAPAVLPGTGSCRKNGERCWDNWGPASCRLTCCSRQYKNGMGGHVCSGDSKPAVCWQKGHVCHDNNDNINSCSFNCCSGYGTERNKVHTCDAPGATKLGIIGFRPGVDDHYGQELILASIPCWEAGKVCWDNGGIDSCWLRCCSKTYVKKGSQNVCAAVPNKCYARFTPCWNAPEPSIPADAYWYDVHKGGQKTKYVSCFQCCARITTNGESRWPAWDDYYVGNGRHDDTTRWASRSDGVLAALAALDPSGEASKYVPGYYEPPSTSQQAAEKFGTMTLENGVKVAMKATKYAKAGGPVGMAASFVFQLVLGGVGHITTPGWDLCD